MISYIKGNVLDKGEKHIVVLNNDIGYKVFSSTNILDKYSINDSIGLFIHTIYREDSVSLYGFLSKEDMKLFEMLLDVKGIGPKMAIDIIGYSRARFYEAIINQNVSLLTTIKGLGKKTAERLILELKNKVYLTEEINMTDINNLNYSEVIEALESLGYEKYKISKKLNKIPKEINDTEDIIKWFLKNI